MSSTATKKTAHADAIPPLTKSWLMKCDAGFPAPLSELDQLQISVEEPEPDGNSDLIFGKVLSTQPATAFALENGVCSRKVANILEVSFTLTMDGNSYAFVGLAQGSDMIGFFAPLLLGSVRRGVETEEGSWSAQAQGGPGDDDEKKHSHKHAKRASQ
jgi:hypothetical protein